MTIDSGNVGISLLIVEDDPDFRDSSARWMQRKGHRVAVAGSGAEAMALIERQQFEVGVFDMNLPGISGIELLQRIREAGNDMEVIILTGQGTIESAVQAMKMGACDYLTKPCPLRDLEHHCELARERGKLRRENQHLKTLLARSQRPAELIGNSPAMQEVVRLIRRIAPTNKPVLITGESGTGKEVVARAIQAASPLARMPMVTINCAALPEQLVESELFGHKQGAFTGATAEKPGLFEVADGGTLFIDELGELPLGLQPKLLRVLEDGSMRRIGSHQERKVNVRIIAATNRDLEQAVKDGRFREDLYYRVNVLPINLPPLRQRGEDVDLLIDHFMEPDWTITPAARAAMRAYHWPGNVRELINVIQRATILAEDREITLRDLPRDMAHGFEEKVPTPAVARTVPGSKVPSLDDGASDPYSEPPRRDSRSMPEATAEAATAVQAVPQALDEVARSHVVDVLQRCNGNKAQAARMLGIHRRKLYRLLERYGIQTS
ncbi:MAG: sigma-54-dependent Fis family transcriptional regulator [Planctomycetota bacterium]|nr:MAG: sigma-54-dependent Fis family transcriptional regulator [Planctomycetota bacterium]